jgi:chromosome segregation ATPase
VQDTSTNGSYVDGVRVLKGGPPQPIHVGSRLRLSMAPPHDPEDVLEYELVGGPSSASVSQQTATPGSNTTTKRHTEGDGGIDASHIKRARHGAATAEATSGAEQAQQAPGQLQPPQVEQADEAQVIFQLNRNNSELRAGLEEARRRVEALETLLQQAEAKAQADVDTAKAEAEERAKVAEAARSAANAAAEEVATRLVVAEGEVVAGQASLAAAKDAIESAATERELLMRELQVAREALVKADETAAELRARAEAAETRALQLATEVAAATRRAEEAEQSKEEAERLFQVSPDSF